MKLCVIGTGYVGLVSGACLADVGNIVWCVDKDAGKVAKLKNSQIPIYEPGLEEVVRRNEEESRLFFTTDLAQGLKDSEICFITVDTPQGGNGRADLTNVLAVAKQIGETLDHPAIVVTKSTVPVGTTARVKETIAASLKTRGLDSAKILSVASNPEFLKEGAAVEDFMKPDRVVVGVENENVGKIMHELYSPFMRRQDRFIKVSIPSSELIKYAANAMLATRISFINEFARLCEKVGANIDDVRHALGSDPRIGPDFMYAGLGFGGSCFPKDTKAVIELGREHHTNLTVMEAVDSTNNFQRKWFLEKIKTHFGGESNLKGRHFAFWGLAFKANTDDVRFAPSIYFVTELIKAGAKVVLFDPVAINSTKQALGKLAADANFVHSAYEAIEGADALIICTEWREFRSPDFDRMKSTMRAPVIFDGRNLYDPTAMQKTGFKYFSIGRPQGCHPELVSGSRCDIEIPA